MAPFNVGLPREAPLSIAAAYSISRSSIVNLVIRDISHIEDRTVSNLAFPQNSVFTASISAADTSPKNSAAKAWFIQLVRCGMVNSENRSHSHEYWHVPRLSANCEMDLHVRKQKPSDRFRFVAAFEAATTSPHIQCPLLVLMDWPRTAASISRHEPLRTKPKLNPSSSLPHRSHRN